MQHVAMDKLNGKQVIKARYDNFIGGQWVAPVNGQYFTNLTPITGKKLCDVARSTAGGHRARARRRSQGARTPGAARPPPSARTA